MVTDLLVEKCRYHIESEEIKIYAKILYIQGCFVDVGVTALCESYKCIWQKHNYVLVPVI